MQQTQNNTLQIFHRFINKVEATNYLQTLEKADQKFSIRQFKINQLSPLIARQIYHNIFMKFNKNFLCKQELNWWQNELRIFVWLLINYLQLKIKTIQQLDQEDWQFFSKLFPHKKLILFQYQSINILKQHGQASKWVPKQDQLFSKLVHQKGLKCKWSQLAKLLYIESEKSYFRTPKQCRQRWLNHLDPKKCKTQWEPKQDFILISYVQSKGKKWAQISKILKNKRNEHSIKNRFKSLITKQQKYHKQKLQESQLIHYIFKRYQNHVNSHRNQTLTKKEQINQLVMFQSFEQKLQQQNDSNNCVFFNNFNLEKNPNEKLERSFIPYTNRDYSKFSSQQSLRDNLCTKHFKFYPNQLNATKSQRQLIDSRATQQPHRLSVSVQNLYELSNMNNSINQMPILNRRLSNQTFFFSQNQNQDREIIHQGLINSQSRCLQSQNQISQKQRQIRVDIFLAEDPFDMLKPFFLKKKTQN